MVFLLIKDNIDINKKNNYYVKKMTNVNKIIEYFIRLKKNLKF